MTPPVAHASRTRALELLVRGLVVLALMVEAVIHLRLADNFQLAVPEGIGGGTLFRLQATAAVLAAIFLALRGTRGAYAVAGLVLLSAFVAVVLYRYVDVPAIGPIPAMYEPVWYFEKSLNTVVTGVGAILAGVGLWLRSSAPHHDVSAGGRSGHPVGE